MVKKNRYAKFTCFFLVLGLFTSCTFSINKLLKIDAVSQIIQYSQEHEQFSAEEAINFQWDIAINYGSYGDGSELKAKYGCEANISPIGDELWRRMLFFNNGELVHDAKYQLGIPRFASGMDVIYPDSILFTFFDTEKEQLFISSYDDFRLEKTMPFNNVSLFDYIEYLKTDAATQNHINSSLNTIYVGFIAAEFIFFEGVVSYLFPREIDFTKTVYESENGDGGDFILSKVLFSSEKNSVISIERYNGSVKFTPFKIVAPIADEEISTVLDTKIIQELLHDAFRKLHRANDLQNEKDVSGKLIIKNIDNNTFMEITIPLVSGEISLQWQWDNAWKLVSSNS